MHRNSGRNPRAMTVFATATEAVEMAAAAAVSGCRGECCCDGSQSGGHFRHDPQRHSDSDSHEFYVGTSGVLVGRSVVRLR